MYLYKQNCNRQRHAAAAFIKTFAAVAKFTVVAIAIENKWRDRDEATHKIKLMY